MTVIKTDIFTEASDTALESHSSDVGGGWDGAAAETTGFDIEADDDEVHRALSGGRGYGVGNEDPASADYWVEISAKTGATNTTDRIGDAVRHDGAARLSHSSYNCLVRGDGVWFFSKSVAGSGTQLDTGSIASFSASTFYDLKVQADGTTIKFFINDVEVSSVTDSDISAAGNVAIFIREGNARITSLDSEDFAAGGGFFTPYYYTELLAGRMN